MDKEAFIKSLLAPGPHSQHEAPSSWHKLPILKHLAPSQVKKDDPAISKPDFFNAILNKASSFGQLSSKLLRFVIATLMLEILHLAT